MRYAGWFPLFSLVACSLAVNAVSQDPFTVIRAAVPEGPQITPYLEYQLDRAWKFDEERQARFAAVRNEADIGRLQTELRGHLLAMIGGLPAEKTPLNARITGTVQRAAYRIEKVIFESVPGFHVTALLYIPDPPASPKPAVLVPCGHSENGKIYYQYVCTRLAKLGYVVFCWDPVGQGERSQFWDAAQKRSRYNLVCGEHAVLGNLAYLAGANLARWEIWDGIRALDYLLTRPEVDQDRIAITGTSGGGTQTALIGALDTRIRAVMPSCYITALPMRMANRIFKDPDSDPEQDLYGMVSNEVDHPGLLALVYPRAVFASVAVEDFFPVEGARKTMRETASLYRRLGQADRVGWTEGYHGHQYSPQNLQAAFTFLNRLNRLPPVDTLPAEEKLTESELLCTRTGQVRVEFPGGKSLADLVREYYLERKGQPAPGLQALYHGRGYPGIDRWEVAPYSNHTPEGRISWQLLGSDNVDGYAIDRYLLHHSGRLSIPLLHIRKPGAQESKAVLWFKVEGKATASDWDAVRPLAAEGNQILSFDFRGLGEDRMRYRAASIDDPALAPAEFDKAYVSPLSGVLEDYVYNSLLNGRPYFLQMIEDAEIVVRFARERLGLRALQVAGPGDASLLAEAVSGVLSDIRPVAGSAGKRIVWSEIVEQKRELWPIQYLLPGGAYIR